MGALLVALLSAAILGFEVSLLRILLVASWHHFAFLVISVALLGFGASGTFLTLLRPWLLRHQGPALLVLCLGAGLTMPLSVAAAQYLPVEARFTAILLGRQIGLWIAYWSLLGVPFFLGASGIGLALMGARERLPALYAANLAGSGAGALLAPAVMAALPPAALPSFWGAAALLGAAAAPGLRRGPRAAAAAALLLAAGALLAGEPPRIRPDPFKYRAQVERLERQGAAERAGRLWGPRGLVEAFRGSVFHDLPFLATGAVPPPLHALLVDGHHAGSVLAVREPGEAGAVDATLMAFPYLLLSPGPRVLLLGERGGANIWLAVRHGSRRVVAVEPDPNVHRLLRTALGASGGQVLDRPGVEARALDPRHFVRRSEETFDLIQLAGLETVAAGSSGMGGLGQDHLLTVEGLADCWRRLAPGGILSACRGMQAPPRDNLKLLATLVAALRGSGVESPADHIVVVRDYLAVSTFARTTPWRPADLERLRQLIAERELTPVWFPGIRPEELNRPDELPGPPGEPGDWYHRAAVELFSERAERFISGWSFDIRPATDDRPFFLDFFKLASIGALRRAFGDLWLTRVEIGFLFVLAAGAVVALLGAVLSVLPLVGLRAVRSAAGKTVAAAYFTALGLGYLFLEMFVLSRLTLLAGDPVEAAAWTLGGFLVFSGAGSLVAQRLGPERTGGLRSLLALLLAAGLLAVLLLGPLALWAGGLAPGARRAVALACVAPLAFLMGFPMPLGLVRLDREAPALVPWAWGVNGFASVLAAPLATALAMTWGYRVAGGAALALYAAAGWLYARLPPPGR